MDYHFEIRKNLSVDADDIKAQKEAASHTPFGDKSDRYVRLRNRGVSSTCEFGGDGRQVCRTFYRARGEVEADNLVEALDRIIESTGQEVDYIQLQHRTPTEHGSRVVREITWLEGDLVSTEGSEMKKIPKDSELYISFRDIIAKKK